MQGTSFTLAPGEALGIVGESGSGKTMLALALMGLLPRGARASGEALLQPRTPKNGEARDGVVNLIAASPAQLRAIRGREIAMVFQEPLSALNPVMRIGAQIDEGIRAHEPRLSAKAVRERTLETMRRAAIPRSAAPRAAISASTLRRIAAARHDGHGPGSRSAHPDCR